MSAFTMRGWRVFAGTDDAGNDREVVNHDAQVWATEVESLFSAFQAGGGVIFQTLAQANASLQYDANTQAWVIGDPVLANNGIYQKQGASGTGSWLRLGDLPYSFIRAQNTNSGNPNAIAADTDVPIPAADGGALISLNIVADNTADAPTVRFNGVAPDYTITDAVGTPVSEGGLTAGMLLNGYIVGTTYRVDMGPRGWSPLHRVVPDGERRVVELYDWTGGHGAKPPELGYCGPNGIVSDIAQATDIRGPEGPNGPGTGDMLKSVYDPAFQETNAFDGFPVGTRPKLKALDTTLFTTAVLTEGVPALEGRFGTFVFNNSDLSSKVSIDTQEGIFIAPASDPTGTSGAWVRQFDGWVNVKWFGAKGDNSTDDYPAAQGAIDCVSALATGLEGGTTYFPTGKYILSDRLLVTKRGVNIFGAGQLATFLVPDHSNGAAIRYQRGFCEVRGMTIDATANRQSIGDIADYGIHFEAEDGTEPNSNLRVWHPSITDVEVINQPGHGVVAAGATYMGVWNRVSSRLNGGHGFSIDDGMITGRPSAGRIAGGIITMLSCRAYFNGGHALVTGHPSAGVLSPSIRVINISFDCTGNNQDPAVDYSTDAVFLRGTEHVIDNSGLHGEGGATIGGGRSIRMLNNRYLGPSLARCVRIQQNDGFASEGIEIDGIRAVGTPVQNPAVIVTDSSDIHVSTGNWDNITSLVSSTVPALSVGKPSLVRRKRVSSTVNNTTTLTDISDMLCALKANETAQFKATILYSGDTAADIRFAFSTPSGATLWWGPENGIRVSGGDTVVVQDTVSGGAIAFGVAAAQRTVTLVGEVIAGATPGNLQLQFSQATATAANTTVHLGSSLTIYRPASLQ